jgi:GT2 family glycosyltransferase
MNDLSAIVVVHNPDPLLLKRCLLSLEESTVKPRILVVDNASEFPVEVIPTATLIRCERNGGFADAVNTAIKASKEPFALLLNDDAWVAPTTIEILLRRLSHEPPTVVAAAPKVLLETADPIIDSAGLVMLSNGEAFSAGVGQPDIGQFDLDRWCLGPCGSAALFRRESFESIGLFDTEYFLYYEDVDWALRSHLSGHRTAFEPAAVVHHRHSATTRRMPEELRFQLVQRNLLRCAVVNLGVRSAARVWGVHLALAARCTIRRTSFWPQRWRALGQAVTLLPSALRRRRVVRKLRDPATADQSVFESGEGERPFIAAADLTPANRHDATVAAQKRLRQSRANHARSVPD